MYKFLLSLLLFCFKCKVHCQCVVNGTNLIPNPSFETTNAFCGVDNQAYIDQTPFASWQGTDTKANNGSTPDVCRKPSTTVCGATFPESFNPTSSSLFTGSKCVGLFVYIVGPSNGREYIQAPLNSSLIAGRTYCLSADLRTLNFGTALNTNGFGAHFRNGGAINIQTMNGGVHFLGAGSTMNLTAQVQSSSTQIVSHTSNLNFTGTFIASGGENRIILGNFRDDASTSKSGTGTVSYLLIDNLQLYEVPVVLPIELTKFDLICSEIYNLLYWNTASEHNNESFTLEKSCDGITYEIIGEIPGAGSSNDINNYQFFDNEFCPNTSYYKLFQQDFNGNKKLLETIAANCHHDIVKLISDNNFITIQNGNSEIIDFQIYNSLGQIVMDFSNQIIPKNEEKKIDLNSIASGFYFFRYRNSKNEAQIIKFLRQ